MNQPAPAAPFQAVTLAVLFNSEIAEAKRLGFAPRVNLNARSVGVRLVPRTPRARRAAATAAPDTVTEPLIESVADPQTDSVAARLDATREAFRAALTLARDALA